MAVVFLASGKADMIMGQTHAANPRENTGTKQKQTLLWGFAILAQEVCQHFYVSEQNT